MFGCLNLRTFTVQRFAMNHRLEDSLFKLSGRAGLDVNQVDGDTDGSNTGTAAGSRLGAVNPGDPSTDSDITAQNSKGKHCKHNPALY